MTGRFGKLIYLRTRHSLVLLILHSFSLHMVITAK
jgi:hypothetical protein